MYSPLVHPFGGGVGVGVAASSPGLTSSRRALVEGVGATASEADVIAQAARVAISCVEFDAGVNAVVAIVADSRSMLDLT